MIEVLKPGLMTTVQDLGRPEHRAIGVPLGGALDSFSLRAANALVGNADAAAALEITLTGPSLKFNADAVVALCGARFELQVDDLALPMWRPLRISAGTVLRVGRALRGARGYLAIAGGFDTAVVLGSRSSLPGSGFAGHCGTAIAEGEHLRSIAPTLIGRHWPRASIGVRMARWWANPAPVLELDQPADVGLIPGRDALDNPDALFDTSWRLSARSNRMGLRLEGPGLALAEAALNLSEPVTPGTLQLPPEGGPIVLMADAQTVGGYPRIGHVGQAELPRLAQLAPGEPLRFHACSLESALEKCRQMERHLQKLRLSAQQVLAE